ncbi:MAG TPA: ABC transporter permease [Usitatibacteraceae bacterium]|nr:ABC transporter permease [Usitatibacteraceae bacterium]
MSSSAPAIPALAAKVPAAGEAPRRALAAIVRGVRAGARAAGLGWLLPAAALIVWEIASRLGWIAPHLLPPPSALAHTFRDLAMSGELLRHIAVSGARVGSGFAVGVALALALGAWVARSPLVARLLDPSLQGLRAVPSLAWVPLLLLWLGIDTAPKITLIAIGTFFPTYLATVGGLTNVDRKLLEVGRQLGLGPIALVTRIALPAALPAIFTGVRTSAGLGWMFLVAAELIAATSGLGYLLTDGRETGRADLVLVAILTLAVLGKLTDSVLAAIETRWLGWRDIEAERVAP